MGVKLVLFVPLPSVPKTVRHLLPMHRLFISLIPLNEISVGAHYLESVLQSVVCLSHLDVSHKTHFIIIIITCSTH